MGRAVVTENVERLTKADAKVVSQRSVLHTAPGEDRPRQQTVLDEMELNKATLQLNQALFEYAEAEAEA